MDDILIATNESLTPEQRNFLKMLTNHFDMIDNHLAQIEETIENAMDKFSSAVDLLCGIGGSSHHRSRLHHR